MSAWTCFSLAIPRGVNVGAIRRRMPLQLFVEPETNFVVLFKLPSTITGHVGWSTLMNAIRFALEVPQELFGDDFVETKLELRHACALAQLRLKMNKMLVLLHGVVILSAPVLKGLARISHVSSAASGAFVSNIPCISTAGNLSLFFCFQHTFLQPVRARSQCSCSYSLQWRRGAFRPWPEVGWTQERRASVHLAGPHARPVRRQQRRRCRGGARAKSWRGPSELRQR